MSRTQSSLIERAAEVYDFGAHLRQRTRSTAVDFGPVDFGPVDFGPVESPVAPSAAPVAFAAPRAQPVRSRAPVIEGEIDRARLADEGFIVPDAPVGAIAEEFRLVKRQLLQRKNDAAVGVKDRMVLVCSAQPNEGKTFCAVNLALSLASERDNEVLLVDADVAKPEVMSMLGLTVAASAGSTGLIDAIADPMIDVESLVIGTNIAKLSVLPAGRATNDDTELLSSGRAAEVIEGLASANPRRIVILDSAPALAASPAAVLAHHVGRVLMIVRADRTSESELRDAVALLDGCPDISLLLNGTTFFGSNRTYGSYYGADV